MTDMQYVSLKEKKEITSDKKRILQVSELLYDIKHNMKDTFSHIKTNMYEYCICCLKRGRTSRKYLTPSEYFFQRGYKKLEKEFENVNVLKQIKALKAAVQLLLAKQDYGDKLHGEYMKDQIVYSSTSSDEEGCKSTKGFSHGTADKIYKIDNQFSKFCNEIMHDKHCFRDKVKNYEDRAMGQLRQEIKENLTSGLLKSMTAICKNKSDTKKGSI